MANDNLTGQTIESTYNQLLITADTGGITGADANATQIHCGAATAGAGNANTTPLYLSTTRVGIGTAAPTSMLEIRSTAGEAKITLAGADTNEQQIIFDDAGGDQRGSISFDNDSSSETAGIMKLFTGQGGSATGSGITILANGKVGIGDTVPNQLLGILGTNAQISIERSTAGDTAFLRLGMGESDGTAVIGYDDGDKLHIGVYDSPTDTSIVPYMTITNTGSVGIGTDVPQAPLEVYGQICMSGMSTDATSKGVFMDAQHWTISAGAENQELWTIVFDDNYGHVLFEIMLAGQGHVDSRPYWYGIYTAYNINGSTGYTAVGSAYTQHCTVSFDTGTANTLKIRFHDSQANNCTGKAYIKVVGGGNTEYEAANSGFTLTQN